MNVAYRFVGFGTSFVPAQGSRRDDAAGDERNRLYANEIAVDVGGACLECQGSGHNALDHHFFQARDALPSAACAVLHHARELQRRFAAADFETLWLVAHRDADFDAFAAMYLVRWLIEERPDANLWEDATHGFDWLGNTPIEVTTEAHWAFALARYAAHVDNGRRVGVSRDRALHSVLYAALQRGRPYWSRESGARELFDAARDAMEGGLDPLFDAVLDSNRNFDSEFALLGRERDAYERDLQRARHAIVFLPSPSRPFAQAYARVADEPLLDARGAVRPVHLEELSGGRAAAFDGLYLRDPECLLFKEWARIDVESSSLRRGFTFLFIAYSKERRENVLNSTNYFVSLDPENAGGANLYAVWALLQGVEVRARQALPAALDRSAIPRSGFERRAGAFGPLFADPWFDAPSFGCTLLATPDAGTVIAAPGTRPDCTDDAIARIVQMQVEHGSFVAPIRARDVSATHGATTTRAVDVSLGDLSATAPVPVGNYRFASAEFVDGVDVGIDTLAEQIAQTLWLMLHPKERTVSRAALRDHLFRSGGMLGVWSRSGVAVAHSASGTQLAQSLGEQFDAVVASARDIDALITALDRDALQRERGELAEGSHAERERDRARVAQAEQITRRIAKSRHALALPEGQLVTKFLHATGLDALGATLRDLSASKKLDEQNERIAEHMRTVADIQTKVEWLELLFVGIYATEVANIFAGYALPQRYRLLVVMLASIAITAIAALFLRPWSREKGIKGEWLLLAFGVLLSVALVAGLLFAFNILTIPAISPPP